MYERIQTSSANHHAFGIARGAGDRRASFG